MWTIDHYSLAMAECSLSLSLCCWVFGGQTRDTWTALSGFPHVTLATSTLQGSCPVHVWPTPAKSLARLVTHSLGRKPYTEHGVIHTEDQFPRVLIVISPTLRCMVVTTYIHNKVPIQFPLSYQSMSIYMCTCQETGKHKSIHYKYYIRTLLLGGAVLLCIITCM